MKRPKLKKASKRLSCAKRYKIQRKVREHNRKLRKEAKKKGVRRRVKKDLGVPNSAPFKEEILREAEQRRLRIEEEKEKKKQTKKEERAQKRKKEEAASKETEPKAKKTRKDSENLKGQKTTPNKNSKQFLCAELNKVIDASDVVIEVLDARDPLGCRCPEVEEAVLQQGGNKKLLFVLNKIDLVPKDNVEKWIQYLEQECPVLAFKASTQMRDRTGQVKKGRIVTSNEILDRSRGAACFGSSWLAELLESYSAKTQTEGLLKVGIVGFPNVGKSSIINSLKGSLACHVGIQRGTTKTMQEVFISKTVKLLDSPGVVASPSNAPTAIALRSLQEKEGDESLLEAVYNLLKQCDNTQIMLQYNVPDFKNSLEFLTLFAKKRSYLQKGGVPNTVQAAEAFLADWTGPKLSYHCKPPGISKIPAYLSEMVIAEMKNAWKLSKINTANKETLKGVRFPIQASSISFTSKGPTAGLLSVVESEEEKREAAVSEGDTEKNHENSEPEQTTEDLEKLEKPQKTSPKKKTTRVQFQTVPIDISLSTPKTDDAYDFNTDFV
ncbi:guanine nucleotide-binding protein-like 3 [Pholidichthys leucotaenia]